VLSLRINLLVKLFLVINLHVIYFLHLPYSLYIAAMFCWSEDEEYVDEDFF
jgi:hypothetical protein